jgi:type I restriction enzyme R subunit
MIGRGTRLLEPTKIKSWCAEKDVFLIMDCWDNFEYFKLNPKGKELKLQIPLPVRLFGLRLDKIEKALQLNHVETVSREVSKLKKQIEKLPRHSVAVMGAKNDLQQLEIENFWDHLTNDKIDFLRVVIKPLQRIVSDRDFKAMRFETDIVEVSLAQLNQETEKFNTLADGIVETISALPISINIVARETDLIRQSQTQQYWSTINEDKYDDLIDRLAPLMKFIESTEVTSSPAKFNLQDVITQREFIEFGPHHESVSISRYKELVEEKINEQTETNPLLKKIKAGEQISTEEAQQLAEKLYEEHPNITIELLRRVYNNRKAQLIQFIKHILGVEILESFPEIVSRSFDDFITSHNYLSYRQLQFLDLLKSYLVERGELQKRNLIESPFTLIHPEGIRGIFNPKEIDEILNLTQKLLAA